MARPTGNEDTLVYAGTWDQLFRDALGSSSPGSYTPPGSGGPVSVPPLSETALADTKFVASWGNPFDPPRVRIYFDSDALFEPGHRRFGFVLECNTGYGDGDFTVVFVELPLSIGVGFDETVPASGGWSFSLPWIEMEEEGTPDNSTEIDGSMFRYEETDGFAATADTLPNTGDRKYRIPKPGATCTVTATAGSGSVSASSTIPSGEPELDPKLSHDLYCSAKNQDGAYARAAITTSPGDMSTLSYSKSETAPHAAASATSDGTSFEVTADGAFYLTATEIYYPFAEAQLLGDGAPQIPYAFEWRVRCFEDAYPDALVANVLTRNIFVGGEFVDEITSVNLGDSLEWEQRQYQEFAVFSFQNGAINYEEEVLFRDDRTPVRAWLSSASLASIGEDTSDGRLQILGYQWPAVDLSHTGRTLPDSSLSGDETYSVTIAGDDRYWHGSRWLKIVAYADAPTTLTVSLAGQTWTLGITDASAEYLIDLARAGDETESERYKDTRHPLDSGDTVGFPTNGQPDEVYALGWGVEGKVSSVGLSIPSGALTVSSMQLVSTDRQTITLLSPWNLLGAGWTSETDTTTLQRKFLIETDGRVVDWPANARIEPFSGDPSWRLYDIDEAVLMLDFGPNYTATALSAASDGYHDSSFPALLLGGAGATVVHGGEGDGEWTDWVGKDFTGSTVTMPAQRLWDQFQGYAKMPHPFLDPGADPVDRIVLRCSKFLRARGTGLLFKPDGSIDSGATAELRRTSDMELRGTGAADSLGFYKTGADWAKGTATHQLQRPSGHALTFSVRNRMQHRATLGPGAVRLLAYAVSRNWRHGRVVDRGGMAIDVMANSRPFDWRTGSVLDSADWATLAYATQGRGDPLFVLYGEHGGTGHLATSHDEGVTLIPQFDIGTADYGAHCFTENGQLFTFRLSGGTVHGRSYDVNLTAIEAEWTTTLTGLDDSPITASSSIGAGGELRIHLQHFVGGTLTFATSPDGKTFS